MRFVLDKISKHKTANEYCGLPYPIPGERLVLEPRHPAAKVYNQVDSEAILKRKGGYSCGSSDVNESTFLRNSFWSTKLRSEVVIYSIDGKIKWGIMPGVHHFEQDMKTMGCATAWSMSAELKAMETLRSLIPHHLFEMYFLTGMFLETSKRSGITYMFRRLKPTVAVRADDKGSRILCCLCLHPIGYYEYTWAGAMVPTDDVIAHLLLMRSDEKYYWKKANQIRPYLPNAGL